MTCQPVKLPGGVAAIVCSRSRRRPKCSEPGCDAPGEFQCDAPVAGKKSGTCDRYMCRAHRVPRRPGIDFCPGHASMSPRGDQISMGLE
jgi:hypothetical protein